MFSLLDVILILIVFSFGLVGAFLGFIQTLGALVGTVAGIFVASRAAVPFGAWLSEVTGAEVLPTILSFILVFLIVSRLVGLIFWVVEKAFNIISIIPFLKTANRLLGGFLGFLEGLVVVASVVYIAKLLFPEATVVEVIDSSKVATYLMGLFTIFVGLLPETLRARIPTV